MKNTNSFGFGLITLSLLSATAAAGPFTDAQLEALTAIKAKSSAEGVQAIDNIRGEMVLLDQGSHLTSSTKGKMQFLLGRIARENSALDIKHVEAMPDGSVVRTSFRAGRPYSKDSGLSVYYGQDSDIVVRQSLYPNNSDRLQYVSDTYTMKKDGDQLLRVQKIHREPGYSLEVSPNEVHSTRTGQTAVTFKLDREGDTLVQARLNDQGLEAIAYDHEHHSFYRLQARTNDTRHTWEVSDAERADLGEAQVRELGLRVDRKIIPGRTPVANDNFDVSGMQIDSAEDKVPAVAR